MKEANADFLWVGSLGLESNQLLEALRKLDYTPKNHFHLYPAPGPLALSPDGKNALCSTFLEPDEPFMSRPGVKRIAAEYKERRDQGQPAYTTIDAQAAGMVSEWQILEAGVNGAKSLDDKEIAAWLKKNKVDHHLRQHALRRAVQPRRRRASSSSRSRTSEWKVVWPTQVRGARREADRVLIA